MRLLQRLAVSFRWGGVSSAGQPLKAHVMSRERHQRQVIAAGFSSSQSDGAVCSGCELFACWKTTRIYCLPLGRRRRCYRSTVTAPGRQGLPLPFVVANRQRSAGLNSQPSVSVRGRQPDAVGVKQGHGCCLRQRWRKRRTAIQSYFRRSGVQAQRHGSREIRRASNSYRKPPSPVSPRWWRRSAGG